MTALKAMRRTKDKKHQKKQKLEKKRTARRHISDAATP